MIVWNAVFRPESLTYTIAKALSQGGHEVCVWVLDASYEGGAADGIRKRIAEIPGVQIVPAAPSRLPTVIDRLIVQVYPRPAESLEGVGAVAQRARKITLITSGDRSRSLRESARQQWLELRKLVRYLPKIDRVLYKDGFYPSDLFGHLKQRDVVGFDAHSQFLHDPELFRAMHARDWIADEPRSILVNFLGSRDPASRSHVLDLARPFFSTAIGHDSSAVAGKPVYWHEYPDAAPVGVAPLEFVKILTNSDFTLCPRGYSLVTHRPIEALLRGSIPVLSAEEVDLYGIDLRDRVNCITVVGDQWPEAIRTLARSHADEVIGMRRSIHAQFETQLRYPALSAGIRQRLGV